MSSVKELQSLVLSGTSTAYKILFFLLETLFFLIIALVTGFLISFPIYFLGTNYTDSFQNIVSLLLLIGILLFFTLRFLKQFREEKLLLENSEEKLSSKQNWLYAFVYSAPHLLPKWFKLFSYVIIALIFIPVFFFVISYLVLFFLIDFVGFFTEGIGDFYLFVGKGLNVIWTVFKDNPFISVVVILELFAMTTVFNAKTVLEKKDSISLSLLYYIFINAQWLVLHLLFYVFSIYYLVIALTALF